MAGHFQAPSKDNAHGIPHFMGLTGKTLQLVISVVATNGFLLFGYDQGVMSGIISAPQFNAAFPETKDDSTWQGFVTAIYEIGCLVGALFQLAYGDRIGRRRAIIAGGIIMIIGVIIQITAIPATSVYGGATAQFIIGRTITGIGNGINTSTIPTYQAECSHSANRGLLICIEGGTVAIGTVIAYWIDFGCSYGPDDLTWRFPIAFQIVFGLFLSVFMVWLPESPRWLLTRDRHEEAETVIAALRALHREDDEVKLQLGLINDSIRASGHIGGNTPYSALFTGGKTQHFRRMMLGASSQLFQQVGGCNAVIYYLPILFEDSVGQSRTMSLILSGVNMIVYAIFATTSWFVIERVGRRKLFLIGTVGQCLSMVLAFACLIPGTPSAANGAVVGFFLFIAFFGATWLPLPWLYPAEVNPIKTRAKANAVSTSTNWLFNFVIVMITPVMISNLGTSGFGTYVFFAAINACFFPIIYFFYIETANRSLEEVDLIFAKGFMENMSYVQASKELPFLSDEEIDSKAREYGFNASDDEAGLEKKEFDEKEKETGHRYSGSETV
ncbi:Sugar transporter STL1 [Fulvia fulva]|uniref:Sugar transporter STL1 n=1 Tax=Passalora fulva TaxID=5499 RepID=A0A9Q8PA91_PASFU|nr:Sugar transporter STL1 [Fulvia fulva]KAK4622139.1 Sugar transporter STL1 [Fulvia fulva]KAK4623090.1 Sugar transporter STL1 [Fulvia fulva]UJO18757.1 Sugar transporter STL1 [Fulvia fulva]WPV16823.1 Sugar transporter STL1 [Fulvia fulva]WPV31517.1 Sugar transporter STL1 [Fulvia fulva]